MRAVGANWVLRMRYGIVPLVLPNMLSYALLRLEVNAPDDTDPNQTPQSGTVRGPIGYSDITTDADDFERVAQHVTLRCGRGSIFCAVA